MNRRDFLKILSYLGLITSASSYANAEQSVRPQESTSDKNTVIIIGAGAAGIAAGYLLAKLGIDFTILEASKRYGGRLKDNTQFADFPISLGAEWLHVGRDELYKILADDNADINIDTQGYDPNASYGYYENGRLSRDVIGEVDDLRFVNSSWLAFFEQYLLPNVQQHIQFNTEISHIDHSSDTVILTDQKGNTYRSEKLIVTVPLAILKHSSISFTPKLPLAKQKAIRHAPIWTGIKVFIEFKEKFYPTFLEFPDSDTQHGQRLYYDAAYAQKSQRNILALFAIGKATEQYQNKADEFQLQAVLNELDTIFGGVTSRGYVKHIVQNWTEEPFSRGAYLSDYASASIPRTLAKPINQTIYFAGEAYTHKGGWGAVHNATRSAAAAVEQAFS